MHKKNALVIILTCLLFLSAVMLGVSTVYRVNAVTVHAPVVSQAAKAEADELQARLQAAYDKQSIFTADDTLAKQIVDEFPYFRITGFEKEYPNRLVVSVSEDAEVYAVSTENANSYYILSENGTVLGVRETLANRSDGADNLLISGLNVATSEKGERLQGDSDIEFLFSFLTKVSERLGGIRRNVAKIEVLRLASAQEETVYKLCMMEGVNVYIRNPYELDSDKVETAINKYLSLSSEQRLKGMIMVSDVDNAVICAYSAVDTLS